ncbi:MAG: adenylate/guanylate cyclase domain-containing protein [Methylococcales bacterium]
MSNANNNPEPSFDELKAEVNTLRQQVIELKQDKDDLETLLEMTTEHSDTVEEELHVKAEAAVRESERRLRMIIEATPIAVVVTELSSSIIVFANTIAGPLAGSSAEEIVGQKMTNFYVNPAERDTLVTRLSNEGQVDHQEVEFIRKDGFKFWVDISMRYVEFDEKPCILGAWNDISHLKALNQAAQRFVPGEYLSFFNKKSLTDIHLGDYVTDEMTVMFSDLRSFTSISEDMTPQQNFDFVNAYLGRVSPMVRKNGGFIVKYLGDGIMAIFPGDADSGVQAGIDKLNQVNIYNAERIAQGRLPIEVGIGVNTGRMMVGMVGEAGRMQGDAFSDEVNLTSRVEGLTKYYSVSFIITAATKNALVDSSRYHIRFLDKVRVKGKQKILTLYEVYDADLPNPRALKKASHQCYELAMQHFYAQEFSQAQLKLLDVLKENPKDKVVWRHLMTVTECLENGVNENWTGTTIMTSK